MKVSLRHRRHHGIRAFSFFLEHKRKSIFRVGLRGRRSIALHRSSEIATKFQIPCSQTIGLSHCDGAIPSGTAEARAEAVKQGATTRTSWLTQQSGNYNQGINCTSIPQRHLHSALLIHLVLLLAHQLCLLSSFTFYILYKWKYILSLSTTIICPTPVPLLIASHAIG